MSQQHSLFKLFRQGAENHADLTRIAATAAAWVKEAKVAPKSIGLEYLEAEREFLMSLGYSKDKAYEVGFDIVAVGHLQGAELKDLEQAMAQAAESRANVICHELTVIGNTLYAVMMLKK